MAIETAPTDAATAARRARVIGEEAAAVEGDLVENGGLSLQGSAALITEFFTFGVNAILCQRGIYALSDFEKVPIFGMSRHECTIPEVKTYLDNVFADMHRWMLRGELLRVAVVIASSETGKTLERWRFDVNVDAEKKDEVDMEAARRKPEDKAERKRLRQQYADICESACAVIRGITASVAVLPLLEPRCSFEILLYTKESADVPSTWNESGPSLVEDPQDLEMRSFKTTKHTIDAMVQYAKPDEHMQ